MNPLATNFPISRIRAEHDKGALDLSPHFQRRPVWSDTQASYLIDSILNDLPVPEIFIRAKTSAAGDTQYEIIDGQQRLRSIIRFYSGDLDLIGDDVTDSWQGLNWGGLTEAQRQAFWSFKLTVRELDDVSDPEVRDMFRRLNANQSILNDQELRHSQYRGAFISTVEAIADNPWWVQHKIVTPAQVRRMLDAEFVSELLVGMMEGPLDKKLGLDEYYSTYDDEFPDADLWKGQFESVINVCEKLLGGEFRGWSSKTEFYSLFLGVAELMDEGFKFSAANIKAASAALSRFRKSVDAAKKKDFVGKKTALVSNYADAVTRASTDLARRKLRIDTIKNIISSSKSRTRKKAK